ncbi:GD23998 [Drosophila simulans]|uniref:GD23998 n=1 Tax=Drosophila simulans TaxID=7240 RepID=B4Q606_DROSI|nr:GD23998 [Drosophila simulans]
MSEINVFRCRFILVVVACAPLLGSLDRQLNELLIRLPAPDCQTYPSPGVVMAAAVVCWPLTRRVKMPQNQGEMLHCALQITAPQLEQQCRGHTAQEGIGGGGTRGRVAGVMPRQSDVQSRKAYVLRMESMAPPWTAITDRVATLKSNDRGAPHWPPFGALSKPSSMARYPIPPREFSTFGAGQHKHQQTPRRLLAFVDAEGKVQKKNQIRNEKNTVKIEREEILNLRKKLSLKCGESCGNNWRIRKGMPSRNRAVGLGSGGIWSVHHVDPFGASCPGQVDCGNCNWKTAQGKTGENFAAARMGQRGQAGCDQHDLRIHLVVAADESSDGQPDEDARDDPDHEDGGHGANNLSAIPAEGHPVKDKSEWSLINVGAQLIFVLVGQSHTLTAARRDKSRVVQLKPNLDEKTSQATSERARNRTKTRTNR